MESKKDILNGKTCGSHEFFAMLITIALAIFAMIAYSNPAKYTSSFEHFLGNNKSYVLMVFLIHFVLWIFRGIYGTCREDWAKNEEDHPLAYTFFWGWYIFSLSWVIELVIFGTFFMLGIIFYSLPVLTIKLVTGTYKHKVKVNKTITAEFDKLLKT